MLLCQEMMNESRTFCHVAEVGGGGKEALVCVLVLEL